eukprot:TRINITY_DN1517_c0_g1_i1.p1 TRINITY_DN1517_c0_g1~~TRINITY_DN1517_c0_g1_i1.p1  ORF type:complete len:367 (+),score=90.29 TRINITY_DN1517_c0_g1_i1:58-1158(+)
MYRVEQPQQQVLLLKAGAKLRQQVCVAQPSRPTGQVQVILPAAARPSGPALSPWCTPTVSPAPSRSPSPLPVQRLTPASRPAVSKTLAPEAASPMPAREQASASSGPTTQMKNSRSGPRAPFEVCDFQLGSQAFDPRQPLLRTRLITSLGADPDSQIEAKQGFSGGLNQGVWFLKGGGEELVLKLVKFDPLTPAQLVEEKQFTKLYKEFPDIVEDKTLAFPFKVLRIMGPGNVRRFDLIAMKRAAGKSLDEVIHQKFRRGLQAEMMTIFDKVGEELAAFHQRYNGWQHCDAGTQNILYDEETDKVTLIDLGGMGNKTKRNDIEHLCHVIQRLSQCPAYGPELEGGVQHFKAGYDRIAERRAAAGGA